MISQAEKASGTPECSVNVYLVRESQRGLGKSCVWWKTPILALPTPQLCNTEHITFLL